MPENLEVQKLLIDSDLLIAILQLQTYSEAGIADSSALIISVTLVRGMVARMCLGWVALKKRFFKANLTVCLMCARIQFSIVLVAVGVPSVNSEFSFPLRLEDGLSVDPFTCFLRHFGPRALKRRQNSRRNVCEWKIINH